MDYLIIFYYDILPLIAMAAIGYLLDRKFHLDMHTYNTLTEWIILPSFAFYSMYTYVPTFRDLTAVVLFAVITGFAGLLAGMFSRSFSKNDVELYTLRAETSFSDIENLGIVFLLMVYTHIPYLSDADSKAVYIGEVRSITVLIVILSLIMRLWAGREPHSPLRADSLKRLSGVFRMPVIYMAVLGVIVALCHINIRHSFIWPVLDHYYGAFIILLSITAGIRLSRVKLRMPSVKTVLAASYKAIICPLSAYAVCHWTTLLSPVAAQVLFIASSIPAAIILTGYAENVDSLDDTPSRAITTGLLFSIFIVPFFTVLAGVLFPLN